MTLDEKTRHYLQWFILCELQGCANMADFLDKKTRLYDFAQKHSRPDGYYVVGLLEETRKAPQSGTVYFTNNVEALHVQNPRASRPSGQPHLQLLTNPHFKPPKHPLEDFKI